MKNHITIVLLAAVIGGLLVWFLKPDPDPEIQTEVLYRYRQIAVRDTITREMPVSRIIYKTIIKTDTVEITKPVEMQKYNLVSSQPLRFSGNDAMLSFYDPRQQRWEQNIFQAPARNWYGRIDLFSGYCREDGNDNLLVTGLRLQAGYKRVSLYGQMEVNGFNGGGRGSVGLMVKAW